MDSEPENSSSDQNFKPKVCTVKWDIPIDKAMAIFKNFGINFLKNVNPQGHPSKAKGKQLKVRGPDV